MKSKFPDLCSWVEGLRERRFGGPVAPADAFPSRKVDYDDEDAKMEKQEENATESDSKKTLSWAPPSRNGMIPVGRVCCTYLSDSLPFINFIRQQGQTRQASGQFKDDTPWRRRFTILFGTVLFGAGVVGGLLVHRGTLSLPFGWSGDRKEPERRRDYGDIAAALGFYASEMDTQIPSPTGLGEQKAPVMEVEVDIPEVR